MYFLVFWGSSLGGEVFTSFTPSTSQTFLLQFLSLLGPSRFLELVKCEQCCLEIPGGFKTLEVY